LILALIGLDPGLERHWEYISVLGEEKGPEVLSARARKDSKKERFSFQWIYSPKNLKEDIAFYFRFY
jgi:hypothetical protein